MIGITKEGYQGLTSDTSDSIMRQHPLEEKMKLIGMIDKILPKYAWLPLAAALIINHIAYFATRLVTTSMKHYHLDTPIDPYIPVVPAFVVIYVGAYLFWIVGYCTIARGGERLCLEILSADIIAKLICFVIFMVYPTTAVRPEIVGTDVFSEALRVLYVLDPADNFFPSIHCLESWACFRGVAQRKDCSIAFKTGCFLVAAAIFLSTLFLRQHMIPDIFGGIFVFEVGLLLNRRLGAQRFWEKLNRRFHLSKRRDTTREGGAGYGRETTE